MRRTDRWQHLGKFLISALTLRSATGVRLCSPDGSPSAMRPYGPEDNSGGFLLGRCLAVVSTMCPSS